MILDRTALRLTPMRAILGFARLEGGIDMSRSLLVACAVALWAAASFPAHAQDAPVVRIENGWQTNQALNIEKGVIESTPAGPGWLSAQWELLPSKLALQFGKDGLRRRTIRNVWTKQYLSFATAFGAAIFKMSPDEAYSDWLIEPVAGYPGYFRIQSVFLGNYLHVERGKLEVGPIQPNWQSAWWKIPGYVPVDYTAAAAAEMARSVAESRARQAAEAEAAQRRANNDQAQAHYQAQQQAAGGSRAERGGGTAIPGFERQGVWRAIG